MKTLQSIRARTGEPLGAPLMASTPEQVEAAAQAVASAFVSWSDSDGHSPSGERS